MRTIASEASSPEGYASRLSANTVDVWCASLDQPAERVAAMRSLLSADEARRAGSFHFERDQRRYVVGRAVLRLLLGQYLGRAPHSIAFHYGPYGKPALVADTTTRHRSVNTPPLHFNLAHSETLAVYAFTRDREIGVDVERIRELPEWEQMAEATFDPRELAELRECPEDRRREHFFAAWTRQEAVLKALGIGLGGERREAAAAAYCVRPLEVAEGFAAALAIPPTIERIAVRSWREDGAMNAWGETTNLTEFVAMATR